MAIALLTDLEFLGAWGRCRVLSLLPGITARFVRTMNPPEGWREGFDLQRFSHSSFLQGVCK